MEGREGCLGIFFGMFIVCPAGWAELRKARGYGLDGCLPTASQTCPTNQLPVLAQGAQCVLTSQESRNHPTPTSLCGADPAEAPRSNHSPALLSVPQNALPWLPSHGSGWESSSSGCSICSGAGGRPVLGAEAVAGQGSWNPLALSRAGPGALQIIWHGSSGGPEELGSGS